MHFLFPLSSGRCGHAPRGGLPASPGSLPHHARLGGRGGRAPRRLLAPSLQVPQGGTGRGWAPALRDRLPPALRARQWACQRRGRGAASPRLVIQQLPPSRPPPFLHMDMYRNISRSRIIGGNAWNSREIHRPNCMPGNGIAPFAPAGGGRREVVGPGVAVKDGKGQEWVRATANFLRKSEKLQVPEWVLARQEFIPYYEN